MPRHEPIAYQYNAARYCSVCAHEDFKVDSHGHLTGVDSEGNEVTALYSWDEWWEPEEHTQQTLTCNRGDCERLIATIDLRSDADRLRDAQRPQSIDEWCEDPSRFSSGVTGFRDPA
ncbi:hypothetical protein UFOVP1305_78 [uncultured Caudovirales phage]|uniref:Uncharacterized protein n=1 Tax=uncultured Caudovirales phage TaxID=2100421 RepID=A0A6J5RLX4_9CAUD|nr:hypothetical protein UFOVP896_23 [uncultured Caudovirales phage]CAB4198383.1 hypothetical protein UFOVP1305_78 [uncultured Caudovirales phage]